LKSSIVIAEYSFLFKYTMGAPLLNVYYSIFIY